MADAIPSENENSKPVKTGNVPQADIDLGNVAKTISAKWTASAWLTLQWTTAAEFATKSTAYQTTLSSRLQTGSTRSQTSKSFVNADKEINDAVNYVKGYLKEKYKKDAASYFPAFGITKQAKTFMLPRDQNNRAEALQLMITGIAANGLGTKEFGTAYWTAMKTKYDGLITLAKTTDSNISSKVGNKNILKKDVVKTLNSIVLIIKGNYPGNYKEELRNWGFQKEKY